MRQYDNVKNTSTSSATPFTPSSVSGFFQFSEKFQTDERFIAVFKDGSDNKMTAICHLNSTPAIVVDEVMTSSEGANSTTAPTFDTDGSLEISQLMSTTMMGPHHNGYLDSNAGVQRYALFSAAYGTPTVSFAETADRVSVAEFVSFGYYWVKQFSFYERSGTAGNYRLGFYARKEGDLPGKLLKTTASIAHGGANSHIEINFTDAMTITNATQANPVVLTYTGTDPSNGDRVRPEDVGGMTEINDREFIVANVNVGAGTFELSGEDGTGHTAYTSGGVAHNLLLITPGLYFTATTSDAAITTRGVSAGAITNLGVFGCRSTFTRVSGLYRSLTYTALTDDPLSTITNNYNGSMTVVGFAVSK